MDAIPVESIDLTRSVVRREPLDNLTEALSGARLERIVVADGRTLILKRLPAEGDWLTRATQGAGRLWKLWASGLLARVEPFVDHTVIDVQRIDGTDLVVMRDATEELLPPRVPISRDTSRALLVQLAALHEAFRDQASEELCSVGARYAMFAPAFHAADAGPGRHPLADRIARGWELFAEHVDSEVVDAVFAVHADGGERLALRLGRFPSTLLHGDAKLENLGLRSGGLVAIDWGDLTGFGPAEVDLAWYALKGAARIGCTPDVLFGDYQAAARRPLELEALDLTVVGSLAQMGFRFAVGAFGSGPEPPEVAAQQLTWWTLRAAAALDRIGTI
jgi:Phosphotransferase enzyme family